MPLQDELNALIQSNRDIVERARTHVGNLAHALKTPLSVITNEAREQKGPLADKVVEQAETCGRKLPTISTGRGLRHGQTPSAT